jgi:hypothetical protein
VSVAVFPSVGFEGEDESSKIYAAKLSFICRDNELLPYVCILSDVGNLSDRKINFGFDDVIVTDSDDEYVGA